MSITIITYDAKCKHCKHFKYEHLIKSDGTKSKVMRAFCKNEKSDRFSEQLTLKSKSCNKLEL